MHIAIFSATILGWRLIKGLPECFQRKIVIDKFIQSELSKSVVDFDEYVKLKKQQEDTRYTCKKSIDLKRK